MRSIRFPSRMFCLEGHYRIIGNHKYFHSRVRHISTAVAAVFLALISVTYYLTFAHKPDVIDIEKPAPVKSDGHNRPEYYQWETTSEFRPVSQDISETSTEELCRSFPNHLVEHMIQPVLKMGHNEAPDKLAGQLESVSACIDDLLIFSDLDDTLYGRDVIDVLADMPAAYHFENEDFVNYTRIREQHQQQQRSRGASDSDSSSSSNSNSDPGSSSKGPWALDGWRLDKYKFLPMVERAWAMRPGRAWYFFYETDTYVVWDNVFRLLANLDPERPHYVGSASPGRRARGGDPATTTFFANGGPGFALSRAAVGKLLRRRAGRDGDFIEAALGYRWLELLREDPCGDSVLGWALHSVGVYLSGYWPMFNPHPLHGVPFSNNYWCQPVLTMHKTKPEDMKQLWRWEHSRRISDRPLLYEDLYEFQLGNGDYYRQDWDNCCWDEYQGPNVKSFEECGKACDGDKSCVQYRFHLDNCIFMRSMRYGEAREPTIRPEDADQEWKWTDEQTRYRSGWSQVRVDAWLQEHRCKEVQWVRPSVKRIF